MARPRYPSDDARLSRPKGITVAFSIRNPDPEHPEHAEVFEHPERRGIWLGLLVIAGQAFAGRTDDRVTLSQADLTWCTRRAQRAHALAALRAVCDLMGYSVTDHGRHVVVHVKNLSQNQGWTPQTPRSRSGTTSASESYSESDTDSDSELRKEAEQRAPDGAGSAASIGSESADAEDLQASEPKPPIETDRAASSDPPDPEPPPPRKAPKVRRKKASRKQPQLIQAPRVLPSDPEKLRQVLLAELAQYGPQNAYFARIRERELWLDAELPAMRAWVDEEPGKRTLLKAVHAWWRNYVDRDDRRWRDEAAAEAARAHADRIAAEIAAEQASGRGPPEPEFDVAELIERVN